MTNQEIYRKTLTFSLHRLLLDVVSFLVLGGLGVLGFAVAEKAFDQGLAGLAVGLLIGLIALVFLLRYGSYTYKAGQIAMMTKGVTEGELPDDVLAEGKAVVKKRFVTVALFFAATSLIRGIFNQLGKGITNLGEKVGGDTGSTIGSVIDTGIQVVVGYLCDCCLGWMFYRSDVNAARATCEGAVLFFKHGKTLMKNLGRVFGMGILSLLLIGGVFMGIFAAIFSAFPAVFQTLSHEIMEAAVELEQPASELLANPQNVMLLCAGLAALILWSILHSVFVRPFVLVGVLRNYMASGMEEIPSDSAFSLLDSKSAKFRKLHAEAV